MFFVVKGTGCWGARQGTGQGRLEPGHRPGRKLGEKRAVFRKNGICVSLVRSGPETAKTVDAGVIIVEPENSIKTQLPTQLKQMKIDHGDVAT
jgi:hypothetical protein